MILTQEAHENGVECTHAELAGQSRTRHDGDTLLHLSGSLTGKRKGQDAGRIGAFAKKPGYTAGQHTGFTGAGSRHDQRRAIGVDNSFFLPGIKVIQYHIFVHHRPLGDSTNFYCTNLANS